MSASDKSQAAPDLSSGAGAGPGPGNSGSVPAGAAKAAAPAAKAVKPAAGQGDRAKAVKKRVVEVEGKSAHEILAQIDMFAELPAAHQREIAALGEEVQFKKNATIFSEGDPGDTFYIILDGAIRISRFVPGMGEEALAVLRTGAYFGEMSLVDDETRSAAAIVHERCRLFAINRNDLHDLLFVDRDLAYELLWSFVRTLSRRLRATNDKMTFLATTNKF